MARLLAARATLESDAGQPQKAFALSRSARVWPTT
jgi:hypothetical protein